LRARGPSLVVARLESDEAVLRLAEPVVSERARHRRSELYVAGFGGGGGGSSFASHTDANPFLLCVPSQNGLFSEPPQRQSEMTVRPASPYGRPCPSTSSISPSTRRGPLSFAWIFISSSPS